MKIIGISTAHTIEHDNETYVRFSTNSWFQFMGESLEPIYDESEWLEKIFQTINDV